MHAILHVYGFGSIIGNIRFFLLTINIFVALSKRPIRLVRSLLLLTFLVQTNANASFEDLETGARTIGLAGAVVALPQGSEGMISNPAALTIKATSFDFFSSYSKPFNIEELHSGTIAGSYSFQHVCLGGSIHYFGNELYRENQYRIAIAL